VLSNRTNYSIDSKILIKIKTAIKAIMFESTAAIITMPLLIYAEEFVQIIDHADLYENGIKRLNY
jgi:hypothetical protein